MTTVIIPGKLHLSTPHQPRDMTLSIIIITIIIIDGRYNLK